MNGWRPVEPLLTTGGNIGGGRPAAGSYNVRFAVEIQAGACLCTDRDNPGDTLTWADIACASPPAGYSDAAAAGREAKRLAGEYAQAGTSRPGTAAGRGDGDR